MKIWATDPHVCIDYMRMINVIFILYINIYEIILFDHLLPAVEKGSRSAKAPTPLLNFAPPPMFVKYLKYHSTHLVLYLLSIFFTKNKNPFPQKVRENGPSRVRLEFLLHPPQEYKYPPTNLFTYLLTYPLHSGGHKASSTACRHLALSFART